MDSVWGVIQTGLTFATCMFPDIEHQLKVKNGKRAALLAGCFAFGLLLLGSLYNVMFFQCRSYFCAKELLTLYFMFPCAVYVMWAIQSYDSNVQAKEASVKDAKKQLHSTFQHFLKEMNDMLASAQEASVMMAERTFESKRRDFLRFLQMTARLFGRDSTDLPLRKKQRAPTTNPQAADTCEDPSELVLQLRRFVCNWLHIFEEASVDPISHPHRPLAARELDRCNSILAVTDLVAERLNVAGVDFMTAKTNQDKLLVQSLRQEGDTLEANMQGDANTPGRSRVIQCLQIDPTCGFKLSKADSSDGFPLELRLGVVRLTVLSQEHTNLLFGLLVVWVIALIELFHVTKTSWMVLVCLVVGTVCLCSLLYHFEEIDRVQRMVQEMRTLERQVLNMEAHRKEMDVFWGNIQQLVDFWLYRSQPCLNLAAELCGELQLQEDPASAFNAANEGLEALNKCMPNRSVWLGPTAISQAEKQRVGQQLTKITNLRNFENIIGAIRAIK